MPYTNVFDNPVADDSRLESVEIDARQAEVKRGDALFTVSSETPQEVGMSSIWLFDLPNVYLNSFCFGYRQDGSFDDLYLAYMLRSRSFRAQIELLAQGISRFNISRRGVMGLSVPVPEIAEQRAIGALFRDLDSLIALQQREGGTWQGAEAPGAPCMMMGNIYTFPIIRLRRKHCRQQRR